MNKLKEEVSEQLQLPVVKNNELIRKARHDLSAKELTLIDFMISKVKPNDQQLTTIQTTIYELNRICQFGHGTMNIETTKKALLDLTTKAFWIEKPNKDITTARWLNKATISANGLECELKLDNDLVPYLLNLIPAGGYTTFYFKDIVNLKSIYSKRLYEFLRSFEYLNKGVKISVRELQVALGREQTPWHRLNDKNVKPAIKEIEKKTDMRIQMDVQKKGSTVEYVYFQIDNHLQETVETSELPIVPLFNWLNE